MRLFLYLFALLAGFSPAEASRSALAAPVAVSCVAQGRIAVSHAQDQEAHRSLLQPVSLRPVDAHVVATMLAFSGVAFLSVELTDRPRT